MGLRRWQKAWLPAARFPFGGAGTIATALEIIEPVPESFARVRALVDDVLLVDDADLKDAMHVVARHLGLLVEPAGAAGIAALARHQAAIAGERVAVILTGAGTPDDERRAGDLTTRSI